MAVEKAPHPTTNKVTTGSFTSSIGSRSRTCPTPTSIDEYFHGPRDIQKHSKWPYFLRLQGSVTPKMIVPLVIIGGWATAITCISKFAYSLEINSVLLTVLGFVVGLALSFRCSTAYERYSEGRKYWAQLMLTSRNLARLIWVHAQERDDPALGKSDLLTKLTALNLINAFAVALKHRLRFEPSAEYEDLAPLISHLDTFASAANQSALRGHPMSSLQEWGCYLGCSIAESNPRKIIKQSKDNLGNLPLEILTYLSAYFESCFQNATLKTPIHQTYAMNNIASLADVITGTERILNTPLPLAYSIAISQITHLYILVLPFQLYKTLGWITIPGTLVAAYIIIGLATIGYEIENPFGQDVNDLPLDIYCRELAADIDVLASKPPPRPEDFASVATNKVLYPLDQAGYTVWEGKSLDEIRGALRKRATTARSRNAQNARTLQTQTAGCGDGGFATFEV